MAEVKAKAASEAATTAVLPREEEKKFFIGVTKDCPLSFVTVPTHGGEGAISFQKHTQKLVDDGKGILHLGGEQPGGFITLFADEVAKVREYILTHGVRWISRQKDNVRVDIVELNSKPDFRRSRRQDSHGNVDPLAQYMFMTAADKISAMDRDGEVTPKTIAEELAEAK